MAYRDEDDTLRARVAGLEGQLEAANQRLGRLTGEGVAPAATTYSRFLGANTLIEHERAFDFELSNDGLEALADLWRSRFKQGARVSQVGRTLTLSSSHVNATAVVKDGKTVLKATDNLRINSVLLGFASFGSAATVFSGLIQFAKAYLSTYAHLLWMVPLSSLVAYGFWRAVMRRSAIETAKKFAGKFEAMVEVVEREAPTVEGLRIAEPNPEAESEADAELADELEAEAEMQTDA
jgi:Flp pilus assembly protein TadB